MISDFSCVHVTGMRTKSKQEPPPRYSITIHNLYPRKKLVIYWVTNGLSHVLKTEISCCMSCISSSLVSRSIFFLLVFDAETGSMP